MNKISRPKNRVNRKVIIKAVAAVLLAVILTVFSNYAVPLPPLLKSIIKIGSAAALIYILASLRTESR